MGSLGAEHKLWQGDLPFPSGADSQGDALAGGVALLTMCLQGLAYFLQVSESGFEPRHQTGCGHTLVEGPKAHTAPGMAPGGAGGQTGDTVLRGALRGLSQLPRAEGL